LTAKQRVASVLASVFVEAGCCGLRGLTGGRGWREHWRANFFLLERGRASVLRDDHHIADLGPGDFFGEIALLERDDCRPSVASSRDQSGSPNPAGSPKTCPNSPER
jgi:CRP-like cAMP-binding protein